MQVYWWADNLSYGLSAASLYSRTFGINFQDSRALLSTMLLEDFTTA